MQNQTTPDPRVETLARLVADAAEKWTGADWCHEIGRDADGEPSYCHGEVDGCEICAQAKIDALMAQTLGCAAIWDAQNGSWRGALVGVHGAASLEREYGDAPAWGPVEAQVEAWTGEEAAR